MPKTDTHHPQAWLLATLLHAGTGLSPVQLQKTLFLLGKRRSKAMGRGFYEFEAYHYGPFCPQVYRDAEDLAGFGYIEIDETNGRRLRKYQLTEQGVKLATNTAATLDPEAVEYLKRLVAWVKPLSFHQLVRAIYHEYPEMRANSVFQG